MYLEESLRCFFIDHEMLENQIIAKDKCLAAGKKWARETYEALEAGNVRLLSLRPV